MTRIRRELVNNNYSRISVETGPSTGPAGEFTNLNTHFQELIHTEGGRRRLALYIERLQERLDDAEWRYGE